jgi:hypothetical protein
MRVVDLAAARKQRRSALLRAWQPEEIAELMRLHAELKRGTEGLGYEYGETEQCEPQFYILSAGPAKHCLSCVSRLSRDGRPWYVIEDGFGGLLIEGDCLGTLVNRTARLNLLTHYGLLFVTPILGQLLAKSVFSAESLEAATDLCLMLA